MAQVIERACGAAVGLHLADEMLGAACRSYGYLAGVVLLLRESVPVPAGQSLAHPQTSVRFEDTLAHRDRCVKRVGIVHRDCRLGA